MQAADLTRLEYTAFIKRRAAELGFMACGISRAEFLADDAPRLEQWLARGMQGQMRWMENHFDKRLDPRRLVDGAKSVISLLLNYYPPADEQQPDDTLKVSKYAYGRDYHHVIKGKLKTLLQDMQAHIGEIGGRAFVDSAPVLDKAWARKSGLGWVGKNANLITPGAGSFYFIAELIVDVELSYDGPIRDYCGSCTRCLDACPTQAIVEPYVVDGSKCISYFTIELKDQLPASVAGQFGNWIFGCDICQDVCPWNRFSQPTGEEDFRPHPQLKDLRPADWQEITHEVFNELFRHSAVKRTGYAGLTRNIRFVAGDATAESPAAPTD
ncbi:tRNA epoxyqueuosine(34) reductase QueG [Hymenobacter sp. B81]|uniref:tRNA epoxyqueuosine(34) reductase QueG n=1 Tax=Hymenobacter sp. B81 TaxID=3344878 RepID=UPI0037DCAB9E